MLKVLKILLLLFIFTSLIFIAHVFILKFFSKPDKNSKFNLYPLIASGLESESYVLDRLYSGNTFGVWYDIEEKLFVLAAEVYEHETLGDRTRHLFYLDHRGSFIQSEKFLDGHMDELETNTKYRRIVKIPERKYIPEYKFSELDGVIKLEHFQKEEFTWPYFYYYIPVIGFEWKGIGFISYSHNGENFKFRIPMEYYSRFMYLDGNYDGQLYHYPAQEYIADIAFFEVDESSYSSGSGSETHRDGHGIYVVHKK